MSNLIVLEDSLARFRDVTLFREWLANRGDKTFNFLSNDNCCLAQWLNECMSYYGYMPRDVFVGFITYRVDNVTREMPQLYRDIFSGEYEDELTESHVPFNLVLSKLNTLI